VPVKDTADHEQSEGEFIAQDLVQADPGCCDPVQLHVARQKTKGMARS
jgi:hypothetical protein